MNEYIVHFGAVRLRVTGQGNLRLKLKSYDDIDETDLVPIPLQAATDRTPTQLANFTHQSARLRIETTEIDERFQISQVLIYMKPVSGSYPQ
jgi:hypothetical protein